MKHILQLTSFLLLLAMVFSTCELPEQDNPWDENTKRDPDSWAPEKLTVEDISITSKKISWSYSGDTRIEGFQIERKENQGDWGNTIKISDNQASEWVDENIVPDTAITYTYRLVAIAGVNKSTETSTSVKVTFPGLTNLSVGVSNDTIVSLNWDYAASGHEGFKIDKRKANEAWQTGYSTLSNDLKTFTDNEKTLPEHPYYYRVYAYYKNYSSVPMTDSIIFPTVTTTTPSQIETTTAIGGGTVTSGANITARGVVWSTSQNPTVSLTTKTNNGAGTGLFTSSLTGLLPSTTYYVRAYATNHFGTAYGNQLSFTTATPATLATLTTSSISNLTTNSATSGGNITSDGGATVTSRGVVWSTLQNPTTTLSTKTIDGSGTGTFSSSLSNLTPTTTYYVRAYAVNSAGTSYGNQISFTTSTPISSPVLSTVSVSNITTTTASSGGNITSDGGSSITSRGVVWSTSQNPTVSLSTKTNNGTGTGSFSSSLTGLSPSTTYYVRAYATSLFGTAYGNQVSFTTSTPITVPVLTTLAATDITTSSASSGGTISSDGGASITSRGVVWSTSQNPTISLSTKTSNGSGTGSFTSSLTALSASTTYYVRAYATNSIGTSYGNQISFTTNEQVTTTVVEVLNPTTGMTWMDRNLGASRVATSSTDSQAYGDLYQWGRDSDGHEKRTSQTTSSLSSSDTPGHGQFITAGSGSNYDWRSPQNNNLWQGENGTNNPCPEGFRIPTAAEWNAELASWSSKNSTGAFASPLKLPVAGFRYNSDGSLYYVGSLGYYWSGTVDGSYAQGLDFDSGFAVMGSGLRAYGYSVRCLKDGVTITLPTLSTSSITSITTSSASSGGNITSDGGASVTARGVVWSTSQNPTVSLSTKSNNGTGTGSFTSSISGLSASTTYFIRAYATNSMGTAYGNQISFTTTTPISTPVLTTVVVSNITTSTASSGGTISSDGGATVTSRGVVWSTSQNPTVSLSTKTSNGTGTGSFTSSLTGLNASTTYYVRAYATNSAGTAYGNQLSFTTTASSTVSTVISPTGKVWMDRNLGASRVAISSSDTEAYGDLYQWGRGTDGHEKRNSSTTNSLSSTNTPGHNKFILSSSGNLDWRSTQNNNLWQGSSGTNNPCPTGFRLPTASEWEAERLTWNTKNTSGAFNSSLKITISGGRNYINGSLFNVDSFGYYWSSSANGSTSQNLIINSNNASVNSEFRAMGLSIRCIQN
ncbi:MAG: FISUMP domain-containing protein [Paludibacter sp.]|jgi:uncharacterized protein (TIGR02145 family)|nr:FISUMP domain-containing protein [Paludibacter sp.]